MSTSTTAEVFWGFPLSEEDAHRTDDVHFKWSDPVQVTLFGDDGDMRQAIAVFESIASVEIGTCHKLDKLTVIACWEDRLRAFCDAHGITWPAEGPAWYVAPLRI